MRRTSVGIVMAVVLWAGAAFGADWAPNKSYSVGTKVAFSGITFECRQAHTSATGWEPPVVPALWKKPLPTGISVWAVQTSYAVNSEVIHKGLPYKCRQAHVADSPDWTPDRTPALWARTCGEDATCIGQKTIDAYAAMPRTVSFTRVANSDLTYLVTRVTMWLPRLGDGSADSWGLRDKLELEVTERTDFEEFVFNYFRNSALVATAFAPSDAPEQISVSPSGALPVMMLSGQRGSLVAFKDGITASNVSWMVDYGLGFAELPPAKFNAKGSGRCQGCKTLRVLLAGIIGGAAAVGAGFIDGISAGLAAGIGGFIGNAGIQLAGDAIDCGVACVTGACGATFVACTGSWGGSMATPACVMKHEECCKEAQKENPTVSLQYDKHGNFLQCF